MIDTHSKNRFHLPMSQIDPKLLNILVCPLTKVPLRYDAARQELISDQAKLAYPIRDGIPVMLVEEARQLED
jgi:uncharacterized protein YbaR (Trm112 family)